MARRANEGTTSWINGYPTCCPLVRFPKGASKMLRATGHARMVKLTGDDMRVSALTIERAVGYQSKNSRLHLCFYHLRFPPFCSKKAYLPIGLTGDIRLPF